MNKISSIRMMHWCRHWLNNHHEVTVLTTKKYPFDGELSLKHITHPNLRIFEVEYLSPVAHQDEGEPKNNFKQGFSYVLLIRLYKEIKKYLGTFLDIHDIWKKPAIKKGSRILEQDNFDLIISSYAPPVAPTVASKLSKKFNVKWVADYRDLWSLNHIGGGRFPFNLIEKIREKFFVTRQAAGIISVSEVLVQKQSKFLNKPGCTIENGFDRTEYTTEKLSIVNAHEKYFEKDIVNIAYAGSLYENRRDPRPLLDALEQYPLNNISVHFFGDNPEDIGINVDNNRNFYHGKLCRENILSVLSQADILLMLESGNKDAQGVLTGKLFEYFALGKPILGIGVEASSLLGQYMTRSGLGSPLGDNINDIYKYISEEKYKNLKANADFIDQFDRHSQSIKVLEFANKLS